MPPPLPWAQIRRQGFPIRGRGRYRCRGRTEPDYGQCLAHELKLNGIQRFILQTFVLFVCFVVNRIPNA
jgi:hypothetical protein